MGVSLNIPHGTPWWESTTIWTVSGTDPSGAQGPPVTGEPCYVWTHVLNTGNTPVQNATVNFYWANPSVGFDRTTATSIGTSFVSLGAADESDVLCLTAWIPAFVNGGHECLLVEAFHPSLDPLPSGNAFNAATDRHAAQRNLSVLAMTGSKMFSFPFEIHNPVRIEREFMIRVRAAVGEELHTTAKRMGLKSSKREGKLAELSFAYEPCPGTEGHTTKRHETRVKVGPYARRGLTIVGRIEGEAVLLYIEQLHGDRVVGGLSVLVTEAL
jgi:hypothetical protein